ncbi:MAG TPA: transketolase C-terminal domain-containing protein, partial [Pirellulales bacterium]|nr:transketolase C-terminal domain-containing protein [Pirellulales bacterium]
LSETIALGKSQQLLSGEDLALVGWGATLEVARGAAFELARRGIHAAVINLRFLEPLDRRTILETGRRVRGMVLLEDESLRLDASGRLLRLLASDRRTAPVAHCVIRPGEHRDAYEAAIADVVNRCLRLAGRPLARRRRRARFDAKPAGSLPRLHSLRPLPSPDVERAAVMRLELSHDAQRWVAAYGEVGKRNPYLWKWARRGVDLTTLPLVRDELRADVCDSKVLSIMLCVLLDDVADEHGKSRLLDCLFRIMAERSAPDFSPLSAEERRYAELARRLTDEYEDRIARYPRYGRYAELLRYDAAQFVNTLRYSHLLNRNIHLLNLAEHDLYLPHNMHMMSFATLDLMCAQDFPDQELGKLREAIWHAQCMGRIGNLLSTWRREVKQRDFTSGVFARAVMQGDLTLDQLSGADPAGIERAIDGGRHEQYFVQRWQRHRDCFQQAAARMETVDLRGLVESHDRFLQMHLCSRGLI